MDGVVGMEGERDVAIRTIEGVWFVKSFGVVSSSNLLFCCAGGGGRKCITCEGWMKDPVVTIKGVVLR